MKRRGAAVGSRVVALSSLGFIVGAVACSSPTGPSVDASTGSPPPGALVSVGAVIRADGEVELTRAWLTRAARLEPLEALDRVATGPDAGALLALGKGREVELGPSAAVTLSSDGGVLTLELLAGVLIGRAHGGAGGDGLSLTIETPLGLTRVTEGEVHLQVAGASASVDVRVGEVLQLERSGRSERLVAGARRARGQVRELDPVPLSVVVTSGVVEHRPAGTKAFKRVRGALPPLEPGDALRVKDGRARLLGREGGLALSVGPSGQAVLQDSRGSDTEDEAALELEAGPLQVDAAPGHRTRVSLGVATVETDTGGQLTVSRTKAGVIATARTGEWTVRGEAGEAKEVSGGSVASTGPEGVTDVKPLPREPLVLPSRQGLTVAHEGALKVVSLNWDCEDGAAYEVAVSEAGGSAPSLAGLVRACFVTVPLPKRGRLTWSVTRGGAPHARGSATFGPLGPQGAALSLATNVVTDGRQTTTISYQDRPPLVAFRCTEHPQAVAYELKVYPLNQLATPIAQSKDRSPQLTVAEGVLGDGQYVWACTPLDVKGGALVGGRMNKLEMSYDNAVSGLVIRSPRLHELVGDPVHFVGVAPLGAKLTINGAPVPLDAAARFSIDLPRPPGGVVVFRLVGQSAERYTVLTVRAR